MPNWCINTVHLSHPRVEMINRAEAAFLKGGLLNEFIPVPEELNNPQAHTYGGPNAAEYDKVRKKLFEKYGYNSALDFCVDKWGTKWDVGSQDDVTRKGPRSLVLQFDSAWAPPIEAYKRLRKQGFKIRAYYNEPGMGFVGRWHDGKDASWDYTFTAEGLEDVKNNVDADVIREFDLLNYIKEVIEF